MRVPVKTWVMLLPVLRSPCLRRSNQRARGSAAGAAGSGAGSGAAARTAAGTGDGGGTAAAGSGAGRGAGFFLKKLNIDLPLRCRLYNSRLGAL
jgi:hypothetical protein